MNDGDAAVSVSPTPWAAPLYPFNEPEFVTWWLGSLYLFPAEDQIAIAAQLRESIHDPDVQAEIDGFITYTSGLEREPLGESAAADPATGAAVAKFALGKFKEMFQASPWLVGFGVAGLVLAVSKGFWAVATGFFAIVF